MIELREVSKAYWTGAGPVHALNKLDLKIESGEFLSIMGQSGSGKSTLMNILGCLDRPTEGQYILGDLDVANLSDRSRSALRGRWFGFIFQNYNLLPRLSALEQVELPLLYNKVLNRRRRASEALDQLGLADPMLQKHAAFGSRPCCKEVVTLPVLMQRALVANCSSER